ncbi:MAG: nitroreductase [Clostridia bacterium]|nr:nitroreductase [Clostridia bacterium]
MESYMYDMIFKRKSFHLFRNVGSETISDKETEMIRKAYKSFNPLHPEIKTDIRIVPAESTNCRRGEEYCILLYSEKKDGYLQNIGYLGEQLDLFLVSENIGTLWFGIGKPDEKSIGDLEFVIMIAIKKISEISKYRKDMFKSKRKPVSEIWEGDPIDGVTNIVRFAPSACNSQPWFVRNGGKLSVFRYKKPGKRGIMPANMVAFYNRIDIGIFLCFLEICLSRQGIEFDRELFTDNGNDDLLNLNAVYKLK